MEMLTICSVLFLFAATNAPNLDCIVRQMGRRHLTLRSRTDGKVVPLGYMLGIMPLSNRVLLRRLIYCKIIYNDIIIIIIKILNQIIMVRTVMRHPRGPEALLAGGQLFCLRRRQRHRFKFVRAAHCS